MENGTTTETQNAGWIFLRAMSAICMLLCVWTWCLVGRLDVQLQQASSPGLFSLILAQLGWLSILCLTGLIPFIVIRDREASKVAFGIVTLAMVFAFSYLGWFDAPAAIEWFATSSALTLWVSMMASSR